MVQVRCESGEIKNFDTFNLAYEYAKQDRSVWKISFTIGTNERIRLVKNEFDEFIYEPIYFLD